MNVFIVLLAFLAGYFVRAMIVPQIKAGYDEAMRQAREKYQK